MARGFDETAAAGAEHLDPGYVAGYDAKAHFEPADDLAEGWTPAELRTHVETEHSTFTWLIEPMLDRAGSTS